MSFAMIFLADDSGYLSIDSNISTLDFPASKGEQIDLELPVLDCVALEESGSYLSGAHILEDPPIKKPTSIFDEPEVFFPSDSEFDNLATSPVIKKHSRKYVAPKEATRKRIKDPTRWTRNINKLKISQGQQYTTSKGKVMRARSVQLPCDDTCRMKCATKISEENRQKVFQNFWEKVKTKQAKWLFLNNLVTQCHKVTNADNKNSRRTYSRQYFLPVDGVKVRVCKVMFIATLDISEGQIITAQKKGKGSPDKRGLNISRSKTINPELKQSVRDHIQSLPRMESHYIRKESGREYLNNGIESISQMYDIYKEWMPCNFPDVPLTTYRQYADIFNQCDLCVEYGNATEVRRAELQEEYAIHDKNKTLAQELRLADNQVAKTD